MTQICLVQVQEGASILRLNSRPYSGPSFLWGSTMGTSSVKYQDDWV